MADTSTVFVLQDTITGKFLPGRFSYPEALTAVAVDSFATIRRLDEVLQETGRA